MIKDANSTLLNYGRGITYRQQRKQVEQIVRRIDKKRSMEIFIERSEGSLIQNYIQNKRKTQIKRQQEQIKNKKKAILEKRKTFSFNPIGQQIKSQKRHATQNLQKISLLIAEQNNTSSSNEQKVQHQVMTVQHPINDVQHQNMAVSFGGFMKFNDKNFNQAFFQNSKSVKSIYSRKLGIRPALQELQDYLEEQDPAILQRRRRIVQMLVLCLMRRCHKKLYEALDIALDTFTFFQDQDKEIILKCICLRLIGKIYKQISNLQEKKRIGSQSKMNEEKTDKKLSKKRHSSFMIKTLSSQRVFFTRFAHKFHKSKLMKESSYLTEQQKLRSYRQERRCGNLDRIRQRGQRSDDNLCQINEQSQVMEQEKIIIKMNKKLAISLPSPKVLFAQKSKPQSQTSNQLSQPVTNYKIIIHQRDIESTNKLFPYEYPSSVEKFLDRKEYTFLISSINSVIFSETQCYDFFQVLKQCISHIFALVLGLVVIIWYLASFNTGSFYNWVAVGLLMISWCGILVLFLKENRSNLYVAGERHQKMVNQLSKWNKKYQQLNIIFKTTENCQAMIICWPIGQDKDIQSGQSIQEADSINQDSLTSQQRSFDFKYEDQSQENHNFLLNQINTSTDQDHQKDQVIHPVPGLNINYNHIHHLKGQPIPNLEGNSIHNSQAQSIPNLEGNSIHNSQAQPIRNLEGKPIDHQEAYESNADSILGENKAKGENEKKLSRKSYHQDSYLQDPNDYFKGFPIITQDPNYNISEEPSPQVMEQTQAHERISVLKNEETDNYLQRINRNNHKEISDAHRKQQKSAKIPHQVINFNPRSQLKEIHDIIEMEKEEQSGTKYQYKKQEIDAEGMSLSVKDGEKERLYNFRYLTEDWSESQSVKQSNLLNYQAEESNRQNNYRQKQVKFNKENDGKGPQDDKKVKQITKQLLWSLMFESEEEDEVVEQIN